MIPPWLNVTPQDFTAAIRSGTEAGLSLAQMRNAAERRQQSGGGGAIIPRFVQPSQPASPYQFEEPPTYVSQPTVQPKGQLFHIGNSLVQKLPGEAPKSVYTVPSAPDKPEFRTVGNQLLKLMHDPNAKPEVVFTGPEKDSGGALGTLLRTLGAEGSGTNSTAQPKEGQRGKTVINGQTVMGTYLNGKWVPDSEAQVPTVTGPGISPGIPSFPLLNNW